MSQLFRTFLICALVLVAFGGSSTTEAAPLGNCGWYYPQTVGYSSPYVSW